MPTGDNTDVASTLTDLERKLVALERELGTVAGLASPLAAPTAPAPTPVRTHDSAVRVESLRDEIADLVKFRDQLEAAARELVTEYDRLVERLRGWDQDERLFVGALIVDAGPFKDITTLQVFEQGLSRVDGAEDVDVRLFEGHRALIDVRLSNPVPLVALLRNQLPLPITVREAGNGRLIVDVTPADSHGT